MGIRVGQRALKTLPPKYNHKTMRFARPNQDFRVTNFFHLLELRAKSLINFCGDAAGTPVRDDAVSSRVQKFARAATSPDFRSIPRPSASITPRPTSYSRGSYPNNPKWPGPLPGVTPGATGVIRPIAEALANSSN